MPLKAKLAREIHDDINESPMSILGMESPRRVLLALLSRRGAA
jgi:IS30 family transposase